MVNRIRKEMVNFVNNMKEEHRDLILEYIKNTPINISSRMTRTLGQVSYLNVNGKPVKFTFNKKYLEYGEKSDVIDTIHHEVIHVLANIYCGKPVGHNDTWKRFCRMYGVRDNRTRTTDYMKKYREANSVTTAANTAAKKPVVTTYKYHIMCSECGKVVAKRNRLDKRVLLRYRPNCHRTASLIAKEVATGRIITL